MERQNKNYSLKRESKTGRINKKRVVGTVLTIATIGVIGVCAITNLNNKDKFQYDKDYSTYSEQLEDMMKVDLDLSTEENINKLQDISGSVSDYQNSDVVLVKNKAYENLNQNYNLIVDTTLNTLKSVVAKENGGKSENIKISYENSDGTWLAYGEGIDTITLSGDERVSAESIADLQKYGSMNFSEFSQEEIDKFVNSCGKAVSKTVGLVVEKSSKAK